MRRRPETTGSAQDSVRRSYSRLASNYDLRWAKYTAATVRETLRRLDVHAGDRLLDVGCGTGILLDLVRRSFPSVRLAGIDLSPEMLRVAGEKLGVGKETLTDPRRRASSPPAVLVAADVRRLPFTSASFDVAVSSSSLH